MGPYKYRPLPDHEDAIRLLVLLPSPDEAGDLSCQLKNTRLSECKICYTALSYACGEAQEKNGIKIEGYDFWIGDRLEAALRDLRKKDQTCHLWVAALCVNQEDIKEKNHQTRNVRAIYSKAEETVVHLGGNDGSNTTRSAWNFLERNSSWAMNSDGDVDFELPGIREDEIHFRGNLEDVEIAILPRAWFRRCWALAEVMVSKTLSVQCGHRKISWDDFVKIILKTPRWQSRYDGRGLNWASKIETIQIMHHARSKYQASFTPARQQTCQLQSQGPGLDILDLLARSRRFESYDPKDKIFAFVGIVSPSEIDGLEFIINYEDTEVYKNFTRRSIEANKSYDILSYLDRGHSGSEIKVFGKKGSDYPGERERTPIRLPSWTPNWWRGVDFDYMARVPFYHTFINRTQNRDSLANRSRRPTSAAPLPAASTCEIYSSQYRPQRLTIMEPADEDEVLTSTRKRIVSENHYWSGDAQFLACNGTILGTIDILSLRIFLGANEESKFQSIRDKHSEEGKDLYNEIMQEWQAIFHGPSSHSFPRDFPPPAYLTPEKTSAFASEFSSLRQPDSPIASSIEHHLFARARKSGIWPIDRRYMATPITDPDSILDGRRLATYLKSSVEPDEVLERALALLPEGAQPGDFIAYFKGARVAFVVRELEDPPELTPETMQTKFKLSVDDETEVVCCEIIGECLVNDFPGLQIVVPDEDEFWEVVERSEKCPSCVFVIS